MKFGHGFRRHGDEEILDDGQAPEVEEVLALPAVARLVPLMLEQVSEAVLDGCASSQFRPLFGRLLSRAQLNEEGLVWMDGHATTALAPCALWALLALLAVRLREVRGAPASSA